MLDKPLDPLTAAVDRTALVGHQLRDRKGRWIEMGAELKWLASDGVSWLNGTASGIDGKYVNVSNVRTAKGASLPDVKVHANLVDTVDSKARLDAPGSSASVPGAPSAPTAPTVPTAPKSGPNMNRDRGIDGFTPKEGYSYRMLGPSGLKDLQDSGEVRARQQSKHGYSDAYFGPAPLDRYRSRAAQKDYFIEVPTDRLKASGNGYLIPNGTLTADDVQVYELDNATKAIRPVNVSGSPDVAPTLDASPNAGEFRVVSAIDDIKMTEAPLTSDQRSAINEYRLPDNAIFLNDLLRNKQPLLDPSQEDPESDDLWPQEMHDDLLSIVPGTTIDEPVMLFRGISTTVDYTPGDDISVPSWSSTTVQRERAKRFSELSGEEGRTAGGLPTLFELEVPAGTHAIRPKYADVQEIVLPPDTPIHVLAVSDENGVRVVHARVGGTPDVKAELTSVSAVTEVADEDLPDFGFNKPDDWKYTGELEEPDGYPSYIFDLPSGDRVHARVRASQYGENVSDPFGWAFAVHQGDAGKKLDEPSTGKLLGVAPSTNAVPALLSKYEESGGVQAKISTMLSDKERQDISSALNAAEQALVKNSFEADEPLLNSISKMRNTIDTDGVMDEKQFNEQRDRVKGQVASILKVNTELPSRDQDALQGLSDSFDRMAPNATEPTGKAADVPSVPAGPKATLNTPNAPHTSGLDDTGGLKTGVVSTDPKVHAEMDPDEITSAEPGTVIDINGDRFYMDNVGDWRDLNDAGGVYSSDELVSQVNASEDPVYRLHNGEDGPPDLVSFGGTNDAPEPAAPATPAAPEPQRTPSGFSQPPVDPSLAEHADYTQPNPTPDPKSFADLAENWPGVATLDGGPNGLGFSSIAPINEPDIATLEKAPVGSRFSMRRTGRSWIKQSDGTWQKENSTSAERMNNAQLFYQRGNTLGGKSDPTSELTAPRITDGPEVGIESERRVAELTAFPPNTAIHVQRAGAKNFTTYVKTPYGDRWFSPDSLAYHDGITSQELGSPFNTRSTRYMVSEPGANGSVDTITREVDNRSFTNFDGTLTPAESWSLHDYTGAGAVDVNAQMRAGTPLSADDQIMVGHINDLLSRSSLSEETKLYRGANGDWVDTLSPGSVVTDNAFMSTTHDEATARYFASKNSRKVQSRAVFEIDTPAGTRALDIDHSFGREREFSPEGEVLLSSGSRLEITAIETRSDPKTGDEYKHISARITSDTPTPNEVPNDGSTSNPAPDGGSTAGPVPSGDVPGGAPEPGDGANDLGRPGSDPDHPSAPEFPSTGVILPTASDAYPAPQPGFVDFPNAPSEPHTAVQNPTYSPEELDAADFYQGTGFIDINKVLRKGESPDVMNTYVRSHYNGLVSMMNRSTIKNDTVAYRGTKGSALDPNSNGIYNNLNVGDTLIDPGFLSVTADEDRGLRFTGSGAYADTIPNRVLVTLNIPAGTHALDFENTVNGQKSESEILLPPSTHLRVTEKTFDEKNNLTRITVDVVPSSATNAPSTPEVADVPSAPAPEIDLSRAPAFPATGHFLPDSAVTPDPSGALVDFSDQPEFVPLVDVVVPAFTPREDEVLWNYTQGDANGINRELRSGKSYDELSPNSKDLYGNLMSVLSRSTLKNDTTVMRGISVYSDYKQLKPGDTIVDQGFISTTTSPEIANGFSTHTAAEAGNLHLTITVPAGTHAIDFDNTVGRSDNDIDPEHEVILPPGTAIQITGRTHDDATGVTYLTGRVIPESEIPAPAPPPPSYAPEPDPTPETPSIDVPATGRSHVSAPAVPDGTVGTAPDGTRYVTVRDGKNVAVGDTVTSNTDGLTGTVTTVEANGTYVKVRRPDGKIVGRRTKTLVRTGEGTAPAPAPASTPTTTPTPTPPAPAPLPVPDPAPAPTSGTGDLASAPRLPDGQVGIHTDGQDYVTISDGSNAAKGMRVTSTKDGQTGVITKVEDNGKYVKVKMDNGRVLGRRTNTLRADSSSSTTVPAPTPALAEAPKLGQPTPTVPSVPKYTPPPTSFTGKKLVGVVVANPDPDARYGYSKAGLTQPEQRVLDRFTEKIKQSTPTNSVSNAVGLTLSTNAQMAPDTLTHLNNIHVYDPNYPNDLSVPAWGRRDMQDPTTLAVYEVTSQQLVIPSWLTQAKLQSQFQEDTAAGYHPPVDHSHMRANQFVITHEYGHHIDTLLFDDFGPKSQEIRALWDDIASTYGMIEIEPALPRNFFGAKAYTRSNLDIWFTKASAQQGKNGVSEYGGDSHREMFAEIWGEYNGGAPRPEAIRIGRHIQSLLELRAERNGRPAKAVPPKQLAPNASRPAPTAPAPAAPVARVPAAPAANDMINPNVNIRPNANVEFPSVPPGTVGVASDGTRYVMSAGGKPIMLGSTVTSLKDGFSGTVITVEANGRYVKVRDANGRILGRAVKTLDV